MPAPNQPETEPLTVSFPIVPDFAAALALFGCHIDHQRTREMLTDTGRNIDAALAVAVEEIHRLAHGHATPHTELFQDAIARIQAAAKGSQS